MPSRYRFQSPSDSTLPDMPPVVRLWLLRLLVPLGGYREFMSSMGFRDEPVAELLGLGEMIEPASGDFNLKSARTKLRQLHTAAERSKVTRIGSSVDFQANLTPVFHSILTPPGAV